MPGEFLRGLRDIGQEFTAGAEVAIQEVADCSQAGPGAGRAVLRFEMIAEGA